MQVRSYDNIACRRSNRDQALEAGIIDQLGELDVVLPACIPALWACYVSAATGAIGSKVA